AARELTWIQQDTYNRDKAHYDSITDTVRDAQDTFQRATHFATRQGDTVTPPPSDAEAVAHANRALNKLLEQEGKPQRELTDTSYFSMASLDSIKKPTFALPTDPDTYEKRTMFQALEQVHAQIIKDAQQAHSEQIATDLKKHTT